MPELPDVVVYVEHLERRIAGVVLENVRIASPNLLRTAEPPLEKVCGRRVRSVRRIGKRIAIELDGDFHLVLHLMISGRLHWKDVAAARSRREPGGAAGAGADAPTAEGGPPAAGTRATAKRPAGLGRNGLAAFAFSTGTLTLTEASTHKRASLHVVRGADALGALDPGGIEVLDATPEAFREALLRGSHTLKRALTDPRYFSGIGNAYSDEILHRARLSPLKLTRRLDDGEIARLDGATRAVLMEWTDRLRTQAGEAFPEKVTAFREGMAVHGRYRQPCPACGAPIQRIVYAGNETNYCARCQTGGKLLMDRALSRLLREDWPRTLEELEEGRSRKG